MEEVTAYYHSERLHLLRCLKHMLGYWQDPNHPFRVSTLSHSTSVSVPYLSSPPLSLSQDVYTVCIEEVTSDETSFIASVSSVQVLCVQVSHDVT